MEIPGTTASKQNNVGRSLPLRYTLPIHLMLLNKDTPGFNVYTNAFFSLFAEGVLAPFLPVYTCILVPMCIAFHPVLSARRLHTAEHATKIHAVFSF